MPKKAPRLSIRDSIDSHEVMQNAGISYRTLQRWIASGKLPAYRVGGKLRFDPADVQALLEPRQGGAA